MKKQAIVPIHFYDHPIEVEFDEPPARRKTPPCPDGFTWEGRTYRVVERLEEWVDFSRRGRMARNMRPAHAEVAQGRGSLGVGRFYFRVRARLVQRGLFTGRQEASHLYDIYYDRAIKSAYDRLGHWFLYRELAEDTQS